MPNVIGIHCQPTYCPWDDERPRIDGYVVHRLYEDGTVKRMDFSPPERARRFISDMCKGANISDTTGIFVGSVCWSDDYSKATCKRKE